MGTIAGCLASMSFNRVFYQLHSYALTSRDKLIFAALGFFVVLGMGGEDLIHSFASRISKVAIGGAEVTFAGGPGKLDSTAGPNNATVPTGNDQWVDPLGLNTSNFGLSVLMNLPQIIERDIKYIGFISSKPNQNNVNDQLKRLIDAENIALLISAPISRCMRSIYSSTLDNTEIDQTFNEFLDKTRTVTRIGGENKDVLKKFHEIYINNASRLIDDHNQFIFSDDQLQSIPSNDPLECAAIVIEICQVSSIEDKIGELRKIILGTLPRKEIFDIVNKLRPCNKKGTQFKAELEKFLIEMEKNESILHRPYASIARASMFAQVGHYEAALKELFIWIDSHRDSRGAEYEWFRLRVKNTMSNFFEEWIRKLPNNTPTSLRKYHINLLDTTVRDLSVAFEKDAFIKQHAHLE
ncbi:MAG: hypothetical protein WA231_07945, partial [Methylocella sp.]